jgi:hypothetical protein
LPDVIVLVFTPTQQALAGGINMMQRAAASRQRLPFERQVVPVLPVPSRMDISEFRLTQGWLDTFSQDLADFFADWLPRSLNPRTVLEVLQLPYIPFFSYGETLPVLDQGTINPSGLGYAYETLASLIASGLEDVELLMSDRAAYTKRASRAAPDIAPDQRGTKVIISYHSSDLRWKDELQTHLAPLLPPGEIAIWSEGPYGEYWRDRMQQTLAAARVAVILISPNYLASDFVLDGFLPTLLATGEASGLRVVCLVLSHSVFAETRLSRFPALNPPARPLDSMNNGDRNKVMVTIAKRIAELAVLA